MMVFALTACDSVQKNPEASMETLWPPDSSADKILVFGDIHLGIDNKYSETVENRQLFLDFIKKIENTTDVRELVINGDFFDDWYLPLTYPKYDDADEFYRKAMINNQDVIDVLNNLIEKGIKVVYVPGNHDMLLKNEILEETMPGIVQARDAEGLGVYVTGDRQEIAIEHGHRYDVFSAPDSVSNKEICQSEETLLPPGYFYARIAASWILQGSPLIKKDYPVVTVVPDPARNPDQFGAYLYSKVLNTLLTRVSHFERFEDNIFDLGIAGFNGSYSLQDFYPVQQSDGTISAPILFKNFQRTWGERQEINQVLVKNSFIDAATGALNHEYFFNQAKVQYLQNQEKSIDVVVFGHTHIATLRNIEDKLYVNAGTWIDHNHLTPDINRTFAVITTGASNSANIYEYMADGTILDITERLNKISTN
jgi:UDP-2,3-diacylglucosamine pyrophosphatase LpxH